MTLLPTLLALAQLPAAAPERACGSRQPLGPSRDLYCIELLAAPGIAGVTGRVELGHVPGPFTVDVGADGRPRTLLVMSADGLPRPASLGEYRTYVAWAASPAMDSIVRLGPVSNGRTVLGTVGMEKFTILVSAERTPRGREPAGRVVLRGQSPATRAFPPALMQFSIGSMPDPAGRMSHEHAGMHAGATPDSTGPRWTSVPMPPGLSMLPAEMAPRPDAEAWLPAADAPNFAQDGPAAAWTTVRWDSANVWRAGRFVKM